jgi:hypothetical protein
LGEGWVVRQQHVVDITLLGPVVRRVFPGARSVAVEPASAGRLLVVYRVRVDGVTYYLRVAEEAGWACGCPWSCTSRPGRAIWTARS